MAEQHITYQEVNEFIRRELEKHGEWLVARFIENLKKNKNIDTGTLVNTLKAEIFNPENGAIGIRIVSASDTLYGRFFEIAGRNRRMKSRNSMPEKINRIVWGINSRKPKRKKTQWYNKTMFEGFGDLVAELSAGMSDAELKEIRRAIAQAAPNMKRID